MNPEIPQEERRKFVRIPGDHIVFVSECNIMEELNLKEKGERTEARTKDISAGGLLFETPRLFPMETVLKVELLLPHWEKYKNSLFQSQFSYPTKPFLVLGKVIRVEVLEENRYDIGISFVGIEETYKELLIAYVADQAKD